MNKNMMLLADFYKICHKNLYPQGMTKAYSTWTPRSNQYFPESDKVVWFGLQGFLKQLKEDFDVNFFQRSLSDIVEEYKQYIHNTFDETADTEHIEKLHKLGYLPLKITALEEGTLVPYRVPCATVENTHPDFPWLTNYLETLWSCSMWMPTTSATVAYQYRKVIQKYVDLTSDNANWSRVGCGDFSFRGMGGLDSAITSASGFLTSFTKTSTIPAIKYICDNYNADVSKEDIGSWSASVEHSCTTSNFAIDGNEETFFKKMVTELYPDKPFSFVADSYDYFNFLNTVVRNNKDLILNHKGCIRIRPDSGNPEDIICGTMKEYTDFDKYYGEYKPNSVKECAQWLMGDLRDDIENSTPHGKCGENRIVGYFKYDNEIYKCVFDLNWDRYDKQYYYLDSMQMASIEKHIPTLEERGTLDILWEIFGGTINSKGFRVLDPHIGIVYGDAITLERCEAICKRMAKMGYAVENVVFGVGSYSLQYRTRDTQGWAYKMTYGEVNDKPIMIFKDPKTDRESGHAMKKSQRGMVHVYKNRKGEITFADGYTKDMIQSDDNLLHTVFEDGKMVKETSFKEIRDKLYGGTF